MAISGSQISQTAVSSIIIDQLGNVSVGNYGGELKVETREGEGTEFIVLLPG